MYFEWILMASHRPRREISARVQRTDLIVARFPAEDRPKLAAESPHNS
jgi:hypothetical protein